MTGETRTRDFSRRHRQLDFTADGEKHIALPALPPESVQELVTLMKHPDLKTDMTVITGIFDIVMTPEEASKIKARLKKNSTNPIGFSEMVDIVTWLAEEYTQRPTPPSATSLPGSQTEAEDAGTSSTAGVQPEALTLSN